MVQTLFSTLGACKRILIMCIMSMMMLPEIFLQIYIAPCGTGAFLHPWISQKNFGSMNRVMMMLLDISVPTRFVAVRWVDM